MQRNQSFFASASHLYIYDYFLSSRAKVRQNFGTDKLFLKKSLPQSIVFSPLRFPHRGTETSEGGEYEFAGSLSPPLEGLGEASPPSLWEGWGGC